MATQKKLRTPDVVWLFETTPMTIYNWRQGAARKTRPLPCEIGEDGSVSFAATALRKWAKENGLTLRMDPVEYLVTGKPTPRKPGPKPRSTVKKEPREPKPKARTTGSNTRPAAA